MGVGGCGRTGGWTIRSDEGGGVIGTNGRVTGRDTSWTDGTLGEEVRLIEGRKGLLKLGRLTEAICVGRTVRAGSSGRLA